MFKLNNEGTYANKINTGEWHNVETSSEYLSWLAEGNTPEPADPLPEPPVLTPQEKLQAAGLTVDDLKQLLGLS